MPANNGKKNRRRGNTRTKQITGYMPPEDAADDRYAPTAWSTNLRELTLPSGQLCLVQRPPLSELVAAGLIDDLDQLAGFVQTTHVNKKSRSGGPPPKDVDINRQMREILNDPEKLRSMVAKADAIVQMVVVKPKLLDKPEPGEERQPGAAYIDWVTDDDKGFVVDYYFEGNADLERFRREKRELADGMGDLEDLETPTE